MEDIRSDFYDFIIGLAETFGRERLAALRQQNKWLNEFEPRFRQDQANIDFQSSQEAFRNDGSAFLKTLEEFADLYYKELINTSLSRTYASFFVPFIGKVLDYFERVPELEEVVAHFNFPNEESIKNHREAFNAWMKNPGQSHSKMRVRC